MSVRKTQEFWVPVVLTAGDIPRGPSARNLRIYDQVQVERRSLREVAADHHVSHTRISQIVKDVSHWMGRTLGKESGDWLQRKAECEYIYRGRMEFYRRKSLELLEKSQQPLKTTKVVRDPKDPKSDPLKLEEWSREQRANVRWLDLAVKIEEQRAKFDFERGWTSRPAEDELSDDEQIARARRMVEQACFKGDPPTEIEEAVDARQTFAEKVHFEKQAESLANERNAIGERMAAAERRVRELEEMLKQSRDREEADTREDVATSESARVATDSTSSNGESTRPSSKRSQNSKVDRSCPLPYGRGSDGRGRDADLDLGRITPRGSPFYGPPYSEDAEPDRTDCPIHWRYALPHDFSDYERRKELEAKREEHRRRWPERKFISTFGTRPGPIAIGNRTYIMPTRDEDIWELSDDIRRRAFVAQWCAERDRRAALGEPFPEPRWRPK